MPCTYHRFCHSDASVCITRSDGVILAVCSHHARDREPLPLLESYPRELVYLLHFSRPLSNHAQHYLGTTQSLPQRLADHASGNGSKLMAAVVQAGIEFEVVRLWRGGRDLERKLKSHAHLDRLCPHCRPRSRQERLTKRVSARRYKDRVIDGPCTHRKPNKRCRRCPKDVAA